MPSQFPANVYEAVAATPTKGTDDPTVYWEEGRDVAYVVISHMADDSPTAVGFALTPAASSHTGEWRAVEFHVQMLDRATTFGLTDKAIRSLPIGDLLTSARRALAERRGSKTQKRLNIVSFDDPRVNPLAAFQTRQRKGVDRDDKLYAALALEYACLVQEGDRAPSQNLARRFGGAPGTWANRIAEARKRELLTPVNSGEAGGSVTEKALQLLGWQGDEEVEEE